MQTNVGGSRIHSIQSSDVDKNNDDAHPGTFMCYNIPGLFFVSLVSLIKIIIPFPPTYIPTLFLKAGTDHSLPPGATSSS